MKRSTYFILLLFFRGSWPRLSWWRAACTPRRELRSCRSFPNRLILCRPGDLQGHVAQRSRPLRRHRSGGSICLSRGWEQRGKGCLVVLFHVVCFWVRNLVIVFHVFIFRHNPRVVILNEKIPFQVVYLSFHIANIQPQDILSSYFFKYFSKNRISCCYSID